MLGFFLKASSSRKHYLASKEAADMSFSCDVRFGGSFWVEVCLLPFKKVGQTNIGSSSVLPDIYIYIFIYVYRYIYIYIHICIQVYIYIYMIFFLIN